MAPIALGGFYSYQGMGFYEVLGRQIRMLFFNRPLIYASPEGERMLTEISREETAQESRKRRNTFVFGKKEKVV